MDANPFKPLTTDFDVEAKPGATNGKTRRAQERVLTPFAEATKREGTFGLLQTFSLATLLTRQSSDRLMGSPMISFIIPARNEAELIGETIQSIHEAVARQMEPPEYEVIVVDDDSGDETASIARSCQARVVVSSLRNIGAARNLGVSKSIGEWLLFVDADTLVEAELLRETLRVWDSGAVWGSARVTPSDACPAWVMFLGFFYNRYYLWVRGCAYGCYFFVRRGAFESSGGFPEDLPEGEDQALSRVLTNRYGRLHRLTQRVPSSARKAREFGFWFHMRLLWRSMTQGQAAARHPDVARYRDGKSRLHR